MSTLMACPEMPTASRASKRAITMGRKWMTAPPVVVPSRCQRINDLRGEVLTRYHP